MAILLCMVPCMFTLLFVDRHLFGCEFLFLCFLMGDSRRSAQAREGRAIHPAGRVLCLSCVARSGCGLFSYDCIDQECSWYQVYISIEHFYMYESTRVAATRKCIVSKCRRKCCTPSGVLLLYSYMLYLHDQLLSLTLLKKCSALQ